MDAAEHDDVRIRLLRLVSQPQGIAHEVRDLLDFPHLIIVREDHGVPLLLEAENFSAQVNGGNGVGDHARPCRPVHGAQAAGGEGYS